ncbi:FAD:protein FMN transferase [Bacillus massiliigorillae]|uniref:FAD:protein FMN transferase n=1 Tax=Bacillus massiliigorillae TaxID=1243664 RepID=UPI0003A52C82|nr:FAD:protein FMN transferase [Bacillus massiliigorillae]
MNALSTIKTFECMNTTIRLGGLNSKSETIENLTNYFHSFEHRFSRFMDSSELSTFNNQPVGIPIFVSDELYSIIKEAQFYAERTEYLFNPLIGSRIEELGYDISFQPHMYKEARELNPFTVHKKGIELLPQSNVIIKHSNEKLDINGIAKGWSVDQAKLLAIRAGMEEGFINAGGDVAIWGDSSQIVGVSNPLQEELDIISLFVKNANMATSSPLYRKWKQGDKDRHHIINGQTGYSITTNVVQVTAIAPTVSEAEVLAKVLCMMPFEEGIKWLTKHFPKRAAIIIREDGKIAISKTIHEYVEGMNLL